MGRKNQNAAKSHSVSWQFFSNIAAVLLLGLAVMCVVQAGLSASYFVRERKMALNAILDGATAMSERLASQGNVITNAAPGDPAEESARSALEMFDTATHALLYVADDEGNIVLHTGGDDVFTGTALPQYVLDDLNDGRDVFYSNTIDGVYTSRYYTVGRTLHVGEDTGYLFVASSMSGLGGYMLDALSMFVLSAGLTLLISGLLAVVFARRFTAPIASISSAARQLGGGDFTARAPVAGCDELAELAATFNNMAGRLQTIDNARGQFMGNIAHELRTPMTSIKGFIDGMLDGTIPESEYKHYLGVVSQETGRLSRLVKNMLDITKLEAGEYKLNARNYDVWQTLTDVVLADEQRIEDGKIDIQGLAPDRMFVYADPDFVHQVAYNLVDNAIKFTPPGGVIRFDARREGDKVVIAIENSGQGIAPSALPFVFERFYKEDRSRGLNTRGSGLGLHICKVLVTLSGGEIKVESEEGKWCRFTFTLPAGAAEGGRT